MEPFASRRSRTFSMSNWAYFASRTPSAMFSKSQNTARLRASWLGGTWAGLGLVGPGEPSLQPLEIEVDHRRDVEGEHLRQQEAADHGEAERLARAAAGAEADGDRQASHQRCHGGHHDGPEARQARLVDGLLRRHALGALR